MLACIGGFFAKDVFVGGQGRSSADQGSQVLERDVNVANVFLCVQPSSVTWGEWAFDLKLVCDGLQWRETVLAESEATWQSDRIEE